MVFCERLREARKMRNMTQEAAADALSLERSRYVKWETGKSEPSFETLLQICDVFSVSADWLFGLTDDPTPHASSAAQKKELSDNFKANTSIEKINAALTKEQREAISALIQIELQKQKQNILK